MKEAWWIDSDTLVQLTGLQNALTGAYIDDATVTAVLTDEDGNAVAGGEAITLAYVADSDGDYAGEVPHGLAMTEDARYVLTITASGAGYQMTWKLTRVAAYKRD